jgi:PAS domain S-box-containing protein
MRDRRVGENGESQSPTGSGRSEDLIEEKKDGIEQALRKSEERFRRVVESAPNAMVMINQAGLIEMVNAQAERVFGYDRTEMLGEPVEMLVPLRYRANHPGLRGAFFGKPQSRPMGAGRDLHGLKKDGSEFPVEIGLNPIETDAGPMVLSAIVDISDRKQREASIHAALREKDILLGEIHHRVKNNLQIVYSLLDLQSTNIGDDVVLGMLRESQNRIRSMALIHQTLYESKDFARVDFRNFLDILVPTLFSSYGVGSGRIALTINSAEVALPINTAIPCGLIVNELISNALKHAFPGTLTGEIRVDLESENGDQVLLAVSDDGAGIPVNLDLAQATTLGLQLVTMLVDQLGGELTVQRSNPTRFALRFPLQR